jgi:hypothetical protein
MTDPARRRKVGFVRLSPKALAMRPSMRRSVKGLVKHLSLLCTDVALRTA